MDIRQAAYALTGLTVDRETLTMRFDPDMRYRGALKVMGWRHPNTDPAQGAGGHPQPAQLPRLPPGHRQAHRRAVRPALRQRHPAAGADHGAGGRVHQGAHRHQADAAGAVPLGGLPQVGRPEVPRPPGSTSRPPCAPPGRRSSATGEDAIDERRGTFNGIRDLRYLIEQNGGHVNNRATPDGQPDYQAAWLSGKAQLDRWNANSALANNEWKGVAVPAATALAGRAATQAQLVAGLNQRVVGQQLQPGFTTAVHQFIGSAPTSPVSRVQNLPAVVRTVLSTPHMNYS